MFKTERKITCCNKDVVYLITKAEARYAFYIDYPIYCPECKRLITYLPSVYNNPPIKNVYS